MSAIPNGIISPMPEMAFPVGVLQPERHVPPRKPEDQPKLDLLCKYFAGNQRKVFASVEGEDKPYMEPGEDNTVEEVLRYNLAGEERIGFRPFDDSLEHVRWACVNFDSDGPDKVADPIASGQITREVLKDGYGIPSYLENTERGGTHLWIFFNPSVPGWLVRLFFQNVIAEYGLPSCEIFPKEEHVLDTPAGMPRFGSSVTLPFWGGDRGVKDGRTVFLDAEGQVVEPPFDIQTADAALMAKHLKQRPDMPRRFSALLEQLLPPEQEAKEGCPEGGCGVRALSDQVCAPVTAPAEARMKTASRDVVLKALSEQCTGLRDESGKSFIQLPDESKRLLRVDSLPFRNALQSLMVERLDRTLNDRELSKALDMFHAVCFRSGETKKVFLRKANSDGCIHLDFGGPQWDSIIIRPGTWQISDTHQVPFRRTQRIQELPRPESGGSFDLLRPLINCSDADFQLIHLWALMCLGPDAPYPLLVLRGQQGTAKTSCARLLGELIDPFHGNVRGIPRNERDLAVAAQNSFLMILDNLSGMSSGMSDALCRMSTGGSFAARTCFTDEDEVVLHMHNPIILTGIANTGEKEDLLERSIVVNMLPISDEQRRTEKELREIIHAVKGKVFGALLDEVAQGLAMLPKIKIPALTRMADFCIFSEACGQAMGWPAGEATSLITQTRNNSMTDALFDDPVALAICNEVFTNREVKLTATEWCEQLRVSNPTQTGRAGWPKTPKMFSQKVGQIMPLLTKVGIQRGPTRGNGQRIIHLYSTAEGLLLGKTLGLVRAEEGGA